MSGRLILPRLKLFSNISFLVDTGADTSALMPADAIKMGVDYAKLGDSTAIGGFSGESICFRENAIVMFEEPNRKLLRYYAVKIVVPEAKQELMHTPTILGRDILDQWHMRYDPTNSKLRFTVRSADHTVSLHSGAE